MKTTSTFRAFLFLTLLFFQLQRTYAQPELEFSHERGFYYNSFELTISTDIPNCKIWYTLDGSNPITAADPTKADPPVRVPINPYINKGRAVTPGIILRACAIHGTDTGRVQTHSYIFPSEVKYQSDISSSLVPYWPDRREVPCTYPPNLLDWMISDYQLIDLEVDPRIVYREEYFSVYEDALLSIPTLSLVTDPSALFDEISGIYTNSTWSGYEWEKAGSLELIDPSEEGFQVNTGIRIRGGWSSSGRFPKHAFRLFFRKEYGDAKLEYPLFGNEGTDSYDKIDLRCSQNNSWHVVGGNSGADFIRDVFARDIQHDMGQPYTRSKCYHLFLNGEYWGLFQTQERSEARYAESYFGGDKDDYDVVKSSGPSTDYTPYTLEATDGNLDSSYDLWEIAQQGFSQENYNKARGLNTDGTPNPAYPRLLDEENLIDYIMITYFSANHDGPASLSSSDSRINNFFGIYNRENPDGFKYFIHDAESTFGSLEDDITNAPVIAGEEFSGFNPMWLHIQLMENSEYKQKFIDRAYKYLYNDGVLTSGQNIARYNERVNEINDAIIGESSRWGDVRTTKPYTKYDTWDPVVERFLEEYFPARTDIVISQFEEKGWFNGLLPPEYDPDDFNIEEGVMLAENESFTLINPNASGEIYYTLNNTDPRATGGEISTGALLYAGGISATGTVFLKTRIKDGNDWSPIQENIILTTMGSGLVISEISYNPVEMIIGGDTLSSKSLEFIEIKNNSGTEFDLSGYYFDTGIRYTFPLNTIVDTDSLVVIASDTASFRKLYGFSAYGPFEGSLNNAGEIIKLRNAGGTGRNEVYYNEDEVWFAAADGSGYTLVFSDYNNSQSTTNRDNWQLSVNWLGSPGKDDPESVSSEVEITEVLANSEFPLMDAIELYNPTNSDIDISNWFLSDEKDTPNKWTIPVGTIIHSQDYLVLYEGHYVSDTLQYAANEFGSAFSISSGGERLYLFSGNAESNIENFIADYEVEATLTNTSFGEFISASGNTHQVQLDSLSFSKENGNAKMSPVIFHTIMYHPAGENPEYLMLKNRTDSVVELFHPVDSSVTWKIKGIDFNFPAGTSIEPGDSIYLVEKRVYTDLFRTSLNIDQDVMIFNYPGKLRNSTEKISIACPVLPEADSVHDVKYAVMESVEYSDNAPWPVIADGNGFALHRINEEAFANDANNWTTILHTMPDAHAGYNRRVRMGNAIALDGSESADPQNLPLLYEWNIVSAPEGSSEDLVDPETLSPIFVPDIEGEFIFSLKVYNGFAQSIPSFVSVYVTENRPPVAMVDHSSLRTTLSEQFEIHADLCYDPDYDPLYYSWELTELPEGSTIVLINPDQVTTILAPDLIGTYRLELTVNDGELYSNTVEIRVTVSPSGTETPIISNRTLVYPNPVVRDMNIEFSLHESTTATISITTTEGKTVYAREYDLFSSGTQQISINMPDEGIPEGVYFVTIQTNEFTDVKKVVVMP